MEESNGPVQLQYRGVVSPAVRNRADSWAKWLSFFTDVSALAVYLWFHAYVPFHLRTVESNHWMRFIGLASVGTSMAAVALGGLLLMRRRWRVGIIVIANGAVYWTILVLLLCTGWL